MFFVYKSIISDLKHDKAIFKDNSNKNVDIKFSVHFWNNLHQVCSKSEDWKSN